MPKSLHKTLQIYLSELKKFADPAPKSPSGWLLSACKYPKTPSFTIDWKHESGGEALTLKDIDQFLSENFKSLYQDEEEECSIKSDESMALSKSPTFAKTLPSLHSPRRFFVPTGEACLPIDETGSSSKSSSFVHDAPCKSSLPTLKDDDDDDNNNNIKFPSDTVAMFAIFE